MFDVYSVILTCGERAANVIVAGKNDYDACATAIEYWLEAYAERGEPGIEIIKMLPATARHRGIMHAIEYKREA